MTKIRADKSGIYLNLIKLSANKIPDWYFIFFCTFAVLAGGIVWTVLNKIFMWTHFMGGSGNEPEGMRSFLWGIISVFPIILFGYFTTKFLLNDVSFLITLLLILLYTVFGGFGACFFYNLRLRNLIEVLKLGYYIQEIIIVIIWSATHSIFLFFSILFVKIIYKLNRLETTDFFISLAVLFSQVPLSVFINSIFVMLTFLIPIEVMPVKAIEPLRGVVAAIGLRLVLFLTLIAALYYKLIFKIVKIFISYSHKNIKEINNIDDFLQSKQIETLRDIRDLSINSKIDIYMKKIKEASIIIILISDSYFKSEYCMEEVLELMKLDNYENRIIVISSKKIKKSKLIDQCLNIYYPYWRNKYETLLNEINKIPIQERKGFDDKVRKLKRICESIGEFSKILDNILFESVEELSKNNYKNLLNKIRIIAAKGY